MIESEWTLVAEETYRLKVPGGYLYQWHDTQPVFVASTKKVRK